DRARDVATKARKFMVAASVCRPDNEFQAVIRQTYRKIVHMHDFSAYIRVSCSVSSPRRTHPRLDTINSPQSQHPVLLPAYEGLQRETASLQCAAINMTVRRRRKSWTPSRKRWC